MIHPAIEAARHPTLNRAGPASWRSRSRKAWSPVYKLTKARAQGDAAGLSVGAGATAGFLKAKLLGKAAVLASESLRRAIRPGASRLKVIAHGSPRERAVAGTFCRSIRRG